MAADEWGAIKERWTACGLTTAITGGVWDGRAPERTSFPYCEFSLLGMSPIMWTNRSEYEQFGFQFKLFCHSKASAKTGANLIKAGFDYAPLSQTGGTLLRCRRMSGPILLQEDKGAWSGTLTYGAMWRKSVNYSPSVPAAPSGALDP